MPEVRVVGTAGHVDHGKSTLVLALTGRDPDRFAEEKRRGLTIDLGFAWTTLPSGREVGFVDVPGHERFVHNMLAGVGQLDACVFVVAANEGWMPQSEEHLRILELLGGDRGVIALTKVDIVDAETVELARLELEERLAGTQLAGAPVVEMAATRGEGIDDLRAVLDSVLDTVPGAVDRGRPRLWVDRAFSLRGPGTVVTGTLSGGRLARDVEVEVVPGGARARVRSVQTHETSRPEGLPGTRTALNLAGLSVGEVPRGTAVVRPGQWVRSAVVDAEVTVLPSAPDAIGRRGAFLLHVGTAEVEVKVRPAGGAIAPGASGFVRLRLPHTFALQPGDRFVIRDTGRAMTVGGGRVLDVAPPRRGLLARLPALATRAQALSLGPSALVAARLAEGPARRERLPAELGITEEEAAGAGHIEVGGHAISTVALDDAADRLVAALVRYHDDHHLDEGMPRPLALSVLGLPSAALDMLAAKGLVLARGAVVSLPGHSVSFDAGEQENVDRVLDVVRSSGPAPPEASSLPAGRDLLEAMVKQGLLEPVGPFLYDASVFRGMAAAAREAASVEGGVTVSRLREVLGITRKHAVPVAEALDQRKVTVRRGDARFPGPTIP